ncbi:MAG TPA: hypothetical protein VF950_23945 [Planctomycetota bacterium]
MRHLSRSWAAVLLLAAGAGAQDPTPKAPVPDEATLKKTETELREVLKADYKSSDPADRRTLARKLLGSSAKSESDPPALYVMLREASDIAAQAEDFGTAFAAIDRLAVHFDVEPFGLKVDALAAARKAARRTDALARVAAAGIRTAREARGADRLDAAQRALKEAEAAAKGAKDAALSKPIAEEARLLAAAKKDLADVEEARAKLAGAPDDAKANLTVGRWLAFEKGRPKEGLPYLAKGSDKRLSEAAKLDLEGFDPLRVGEAWMKLAADPRLPRVVVLERGCEWLRKAWEKEDPLTKDRLRTRLLALLASPKGGKPAESAPPPWNIGGPSKYAWDPTLAWSGERSVKLMPANRTSDPKAWTNFSSPKLPVVIGAEYRVSVRALTEKLSGANNGVWIIFWGADGKAIREAAFLFPPDTPVWTLVEGKLECPPGADKVELSFHHDSSAGTAWIDAVTLTCQGDEIPINGDLEPK